jgi:hypothetical protein
MSGTCSTYRGRRGAYRILIGKCDKKEPHARPSHRWEDNIKMDLQEVGAGHGLDCCGLRQGQVAGPCEYGSEPSDSIKCGEFFE